MVRRISQNRNGSTMLKNSLFGTDVKSIPEKSCKNEETAMALSSEG